MRRDGGYPALGRRRPGRLGILRDLDGTLLLSGLRSETLRLLLLVGIGESVPELRRLRLA